MDEQEAAPVARWQGLFTLLFALTLGATSVAAQSIWVRELSLLWFGSELSWGMTLSAWLAGVALGAAGCGLLSRRIRPAVLATAFALALAGTLGGGLWLLRSVRSLLGTQPGELIPTGQMLALTAAVAGTTGLWVGALFPAGCALAGRAFGAARRTIGVFFLTEALGTLAGGVAFTMWWVERMDAFAISAMLSAALLAMVGAAAAARRDRRAQWLNLCCGLLAVLAGAALVVEVVRGTSDRLERASQQRRWADLFPSADEANTPRHLAGLESRFGRIDLGELRSQWTLYLNCRPAATFPNRSALAPWVHLAASQCPRLRRVLIIGQATAELAALCRRYPGVVVESVELDPKVHQVLAAHLRPAPPAPSHFADGRHFIKASARRYDLILLAVGDPTSIATARFYSREFFREVAARLTAEGVLAFALAGPAGKLSPQLREYLGSIYQPLREVFADTLWTWSDPTYVFAARRRGVLTANPEELVARYKGHNGPGEFDPDYFLGWREDMLQPRRLRRLRAMLASLPPGSANTDARPIASFLHLLREEQTLLSLEAGPAGPKRTSLLGLFQRVRLPHALAAMGAIGVLACLAASWQRRGRVPTAGVARPAVLFSLATTGLAAIALEIVLLAAFQNLYGLVYSHIALIVAAYMAGVALGSFVHSRRRFPSQQGAWRRLILLDVALLLACGAVPALVQALGAMPAGPTALLATEWVILVMVAGVGLLGGLAVPLAAGLYGAEGSASTGRVAGAVDAADCLGGAVGGLTCGLILLPLLGAAAACAVYALGKLAAIIALMLGRRGEAL
ncbi:MAG: hypothetical protein B1H04_02965 [Planctomycetales bacterium 4484_123]|nr:MAG: hypothetical protein B1H04_02965 [Planctomycetales bacterium 4484_123]